MCTKMADRERRVVFCAPLCFVLSKIGKINGNKIISTLCDAFKPQEITTAKKILVEDSEKIRTDKMLPRLASRRDKDVHRRAHQEAGDICFLISSLDQRSLLNQLPIYVIDNTDSVPTMKLEEGEMNYFMAKVEKLEDSILCIQETVNKLYAIVLSAMTETEREAARLGLKPVPAADRTGRATATAVRGEFMNGPTVGHSMDSTTTAVASIAEQLHELRDWSQCRPPSSSLESTSEFDSDAAAVAADAAGDEDAENDYTLVENNKNKRRRRRSRLQQQVRVDRTSTQPADRRADRSVDRPADHLADRPGPIDRPAGYSAGRLAAPVGSAAPVNGTAATDDPATRSKSFAAAVGSNRAKTTGRVPRQPLMVGTLRSPVAEYGNLRAAKPLFGKASYIIDNVNPDMPTDEMEEFIKKKLRVRLLKINTTNPRRTGYEIRNNIKPTDRKAFYVCINKADVDLLTRGGAWRDDVYIDEWKFKIKTTGSTAEGKSPAVADTVDNAGVTAVATAAGTDNGITVAKDSSTTTAAATAGLVTQVTASPDVGASIAGRVGSDVAGAIATASSSTIIVNTADPDIQSADSERYERYSDAAEDLLNVSPIDNANNANDEHEDENRSGELNSTVMIVDRSAIIIP